MRSNHSDEKIAVSPCTEHYQGTNNSGIDDVINAQQHSDDVSEMLRSVSERNPQSHCEPRPRYEFSVLVLNDPARRDQ